jgi:intein-encoded DNA endonuclease-like protein
MQDVKQKDGESWSEYKERLVLHRKEYGIFIKDMLEIFKEDILKKYNNGGSLRSLQKEYNVHHDPMKEFLENYTVIKSHNEMINKIQYIDINQVKQLYFEEDKSLIDIGKIYNVHPETIRRHMINNRILAENKHIKRVRRDTRKLNLDITSNLAYILGVIEGDGHISPTKNIIKLDVADKEFCEEFKRNMSKIGFNDNKIYEIIPKNKNYKYRYGLVYRSKGFVDFYFKNITCNSKKKYEWYSKNLNEVSLQIQFLRGMFDSEGCVYYRNDLQRKDKQISFTNTDQYLINICSGYLDNLGISHSVYTRKYTNHYKTLYTINILSKSMKKFKEKIGSNIYRKIDKMEKICNGN